MNHATIVLLAVAALVVIGAAMLGAVIKGTPRKGVFAAKNPVSANEQGMYWRLVDAFPPPTYVVLAQVSFGALLRATKGASRYSFSQKIADFVLLDKSFNVLAVVELDDSSHRDKPGADAARDAMLAQAGYRVVRYPRVPDADKLRTDLTPSP